MMPLTPDLQVRPLQAEEGLLLAEVLNRVLARTPYSVPLDDVQWQEQLYQATPPTLYPVRWQGHARLCAWRARRLDGFIDVAVGLDSDSQNLPDYQPFGLLRFLLLPDNKNEVVNEVAKALLNAAEDFWRQMGVGHVKAFHLSTGYPTFQAGVGVLPGDWSEHIRVLTAADFYLVERFYCLRRPLDLPVEEVLPLAGLSLVYRGKSTDRIYLLYRRAELIGQARVTSLLLVNETAPLRIANLVDLQIDPQWRRMNIGKWLLRRLINDATLQGYQQMLAHVAQSQQAVLNLLNQLGFLEENYRGYTLEKALTR
jgi:GNAT superfamily N-acetyltransferase